MDYVLDACAVIALLNDEGGADTVAEQHLKVFHAMMCRDALLP